LLHPLDRAYSVPDVLDLIKQAGPRFQSWLDPYWYYPEGTIPADSSLWPRLPAEEQWAIVENIGLRQACHR
jgi:hypothetical protein